MSNKIPSSFVVSRSQNKAPDMPDGYALVGFDGTMETYEREINTAHITARCEQYSGSLPELCKRGHCWRYPNIQTEWARHHRTRIKICKKCRDIVNERDHSMKEEK